MPLNYGIAGFTRSMPVPKTGGGPPAASFRAELGQSYYDTSTVPPTEYVYNGSTWSTAGANAATTSTYGTVILTDNNEPVATQNYVDAIAIAGAPVSTTTTAGIGELATDAEAVAGTASTGVLALFVTPSNLAAVLASPTAIGGTVAAAGTFTDLTADGTGAVSLGSNVAADFTAAAGDLSLIATAGSVVINGGEAVDDAIQLTSAAGGLAASVVKSAVIASTETNADSVQLTSAGGMDITATGAAGKDIDIVCTSGSINMTAGENIASSMVFTNTGFQVNTTGAAAQDITLSNTGGSITLVATENAAQNIYLHANGGASETIQLRADQGTGDASVHCLSDVGGVTLDGGKAAATAINILASNAAGGITMTAGTGGVLPTTTGPVTITSTYNNANNMYLHANGGTSETIKIHADQGTAVTSLNLLSDVGGITLSAGLATADAINITASNAAGGIDVDAGTAGVIVDTTGAISLDSAAASNFTVTGAFDLTVQTTAGSLILSASEDAADAVQLLSTAGGIDILATGAAGQDIDIVNTGGSVNISATEDNSGAITIGTNGGTSERITVTCAQGTNAASIGLTSTAGGITIAGGLGTADAINITASTAGGGIDIDSSTGGFIVDTTGAVSLDSALASNFTVTGAADLTLSSSAGAVNMTSGEANADSINITSGGGMNIVATGAAAKDVILTCTSGSMTLTAGENVTDAMNITASGAASRVTVTAGTGSIKLASGLIVNHTSLSNANTPYTVLGTDYFLDCDTSAGVLTVTLPAATAVAGRTYVIRDVGGAAGVNNITIGGGGTNLVGGGAAAASKTLSANYSGATVYSNGTIWAYAYVA